MRRSVILLGALFLAELLSGCTVVPRADMDALCYPVVVRSCRPDRPVEPAGPEEPRVAECVVVDGEGGEGES